MKKMFSLCISLFIFTGTATAGLYEFSFYKNTLDALATKVQEKDLKNAIYLDLNQKFVTILSYKEARRALHGKLHLDKRNRKPVIEDVYCKKMFDSRHGVGENRIPKADIINTEHTWPQSKFSSRNRSAQKGDLHHLFPTDNRANSSRGNHHFGHVVDGGPVNSTCKTSNRGSDRHGTSVFEPPRNHRGNVARALFYFSIRYQMKISNNEEQVLREWHQLDPVDEFERWRNREIEKIQGNRNPFIDDPELVLSINDF